MMCPKMTNPVRINERFGKLVVLSSTDKRRHRNIFYSCKCDCGINVDVVGTSLRSGQTKSCGCLRIHTASKPPGDAAWNRMFKSYVGDANRRGLSFELSIEQFKSIVRNICVYCGRPPAKRNHYKTENKKDIRTASVKRATIYANGIDRIDSNIGYILTNCEPCCTICNKMKLDSNKSDFIKNIHRMSNFLNRNGMK